MNPWPRMISDVRRSADRAAERAHARAGTGVPREARTPRPRAAATAESGGRRSGTRYATRSVAALASSHPVGAATVTVVQHRHAARRGALGIIAVALLIGWFWWHYMTPGWMKMPMEALTNPPGAEDLVPRPGNPTVPVPIVPGVPVPVPLPNFGGAAYTCQPEAVQVWQPRDPLGWRQAAVDAGEAVRGLAELDLTPEQVREFVYDVGGGVREAWTLFRTGATTPPAPEVPPSQLVNLTDAQQIAVAVLTAGWTGEDAVTALAVSRAESGWRLDAANPTSSAYGPFQIMRSVHNMTAEQAGDPLTAARYSHGLWQERGWQPWVVTHDGTHLRYMDEARALLASVQGACAEVLTTTAASSKSVATVRPSDGQVTSGYGPRWGRLHAGIDIAAGIGNPIRAARDGLVEHAGPRGGYGNLVILRHANGEETRYAHLSEWQVRVGQLVRAGQQIGREGNTGRSTGPHLHFEVRVAGRAVDPARWLIDNGASLAGSRA